jgi:hypothetical protein
VAHNDGVDKQLSQSAVGKENLNKKEISKTQNKSISDRPTIRLLNLEGLYKQKSRRWTKTNWLIYVMPVKSCPNPQKKCNVETLHLIVYQYMD